MVLQTLTSVLKDPPFQQHLLCFSLKFLELVTCTCYHYYFSLKALHQASNTDPRSKGTSSQPDQYLFTASQPFVFLLHLTQSICSFLFRLLRSCFSASLVLLSRPLSPPNPWQRPTMVIPPKEDFYSSLSTLIFSPGASTFVAWTITLSMTSKSRRVVRGPTHAPVTNDSLSTPVCSHRIHQMPTTNSAFASPTTLKTQCLPPLNLYGISTLSLP